jgi:GNAT superfamily N-acetyltransferase
MELTLINNEEKYYEFIRSLRINPDNQVFFLEQVEISEKDQIKYMSKYGTFYHICLSGETPVGFVGVIDDDIRICTDKNYRGKKVGSFMLEHIKKLYPNAKAKILKNNIASIKLFISCNFNIVNSDNNLYYLTQNKQNK